MNNIFYYIDYLAFSLGLSSIKPSRHPNKQHPFFSQLPHCLPSFPTHSPFTPLTRTIQRVNQQAVSLIGRVILLPKNIYDSLFTSRTAEELPSSPRIDREELKELFRYVGPAVAIHSMNEGWLEKIDRDTLRFKEPSPTIATELGLTIHGKSYLDLEVGLKVAVAESDDEVMVVFGAVDSLSEAIWKLEGGEQLDEQLRNLPLENHQERKNLESRKERIIAKQKLMHDRQHLAVAMNLLGFQPMIFRKADELTQRLINQYSPKKITVVGQCFGGCLASYVALSRDLPMRGFNTLPLGAGLQKVVSREVLAMRAENMVHLSVETDFVSDTRFPNPFQKLLTFLNIPTATHFGAHHYVPTLYPDDAGKTHTNVVGCMMGYFGLADGARLGDAFQDGGSPDCSSGG